MHTKSLRLIAGAALALLSLAAIAPAQAQTSDPLAVYGSTSSGSKFYLRGNPTTGALYIEAAKPAAITYTSASGSPFTLTSSWAKVGTITTATKAAILAPNTSAAIFDVEWTTVAAGASAPTDTYGVPAGYGETFPGGLPVGDLYAKSATGQVATLRLGN